MGPVGDFLDWKSPAWLECFKISSLEKVCWLARRYCETNEKITAVFCFFQAKLHGAFDFHCFLLHTIPLRLGEPMEANLSEIQKIGDFEFIHPLISRSNVFRKKVRGRAVFWTNHQKFQVPKMQVLNLVRLFWVWVFPYISLTAYTGSHLQIHQTFALFDPLQTGDLMMYKPANKSLLSKNFHTPGTYQNDPFPNSLCFGIPKNHLGERGSLRVPFGMSL